MDEQPPPASVPTPASLYPSGSLQDVATAELAALKAAVARFREGNEEDPETVVRAATAAASELERALDRSGS